MKRIYLLSAAAALTAFSMTSCGGSAESEEMAGPVTYTLDGEASSLKWKGDYADGTHSHDGTVKFSEATIVYNGDQFESGMAKVDLTTIDSELDANSGENDLIGHFSSPDFFNTAAKSTADVTIKSVTEEGATIAIALNGKTLEQTVPVKVKKTDDKVTVKGKFDVDFTPLDLGGFKANPEKEAEAAKMGKKDQYVNPVVHFDIDLVTKAPAAEKK
jgi:hypothetical protein